MFQLIAISITLIIQCIVFIDFIGANKYLLAFDGINQYVHFFNELSSIIHNNGSLFWSWHEGIGTNYFGSMTYYILSPIMLLLTIIFSKEYIPYLFIIGMLIKQQLAVIFMYKLLRTYKFDNRICLLVSLLWAFNSYFIHYITNPMWLDVFYLLPIVFYGIEAIRMNNKYFIFISGIFFIAASNYYIFFSASIFIYVYIIMTYSLHNEKFKFNKFLLYGLKITGYYLIGVGLAAFILIPSVMAIKESARGSGIPLQTLFQFDFHNLIETLKSSFFNTSYVFNIVTTEQALLYSGNLIILTFPLIFIKSFKIPFKIRGIIICILMLEVITIINPFIYFLFHGLAQPICFPYRYMYGFILLNLIILGYLLNLLFKSDYKMPIWNLILIIFYTIIILSAENINTILFNVLIVILYYFCIYYKKFVFILLIIIFEITVSTNGIIDYYSANFLSKEKSDTLFSNNEIESIIEVIDRKSYSDMERVYENYDLNYSEALRNMALTYNYSGLNSFTSTNNKFYMNFLNTLSLNDNSSGMVNLTGNLMSNQILNVRYLILENDNPVPYGYELVLNEEHYSLYENSNYMGGGYKVSNFIKESTYNSKNLLEKEILLINNIIIPDDSELNENYTKNINYQVLSQSKIETNITEIESNYLNTTGLVEPYIEYSFEDLSFSSAELFMNIVANEKIKKIEIMTDQENFVINSGDFTHPNRLKDIGYFSVAPRIKIYLYEDTQYYINELTFYEVDMQSYQQEVDKMLSNSLDSLYTFKNKVNMEVSSDIGEYLFLSIPYNIGWNMKINGEEKIPQRANIAFIMLELSDQNNSIDLIYYSSGIKIGIVISLINLIILGIFSFVRNRKLKTKQSRLNKIKPVENEEI